MSNMFKYKLLVEGRDDQYVMQSLLRRHGISCVIPDRKKGISVEEKTVTIEQQGDLRRFGKNCSAN